MWGKAGVTAILISAAACGGDDEDPTGNGSEGLVGTWDEVSYAGLELPAQLDQWEENGVTCTSTLVSGTTVFREDLTYTISSTYERRCGSEAETESENHAGTYHVEGNQLTFSGGTEDPEFVTFDVDGDTLTILTGASGEIVAVVFQRVS